MNLPPPKKRLGQHFLVSTGVIDKIVTAIDPAPGQTVVEIGPGRGALTLALLPRLERLVALEIDREVIPLLQEATATRGLASRLEIRHQDATTADYQALAAELSPNAPLTVAGNLPYNVATPILFRLLEAVTVLAPMTFMVQKEVADRLCARVNRSDYSRLSVMVQALCATERLFLVPPGAFLPPPRVESAVVRLTPLASPQCPPELWPYFGRVVMTAFGQRRKTLRNALSGLLAAEAIRACDIDPGTRAETIEVAGFVRLAAALEQIGPASG